MQRVADRTVATGKASRAVLALLILTVIGVALVVVFSAMRTDFSPLYSDPSAAPGSPVNGYMPVFVRYAPVLAIVLTLFFSVITPLIASVTAFVRKRWLEPGRTSESLPSAPEGPGGEIRRPSDGKVPENIVFIQCVGSRDEKRGVSYCSKVCCMYTAKHTMLYRHKVHEGQAYVFYMDIRSGGKRYDEFVRNAIEKDGAVYLRGRVSRVYEKNGKIAVQGADTLSGSQVVIEADMVVLATALVSRPGAGSLAQKLGIGYDKHGFYNEYHPKLKPVETVTGGIFLAGTCVGPLDIPESVSMGSAAASKVQALFSADMLEREPITAKVNPATCNACWDCVVACPYSAIEKSEVKNREGKTVSWLAKVNDGLCAGCGVCVAACRSKTIDLGGYTDEQVYAAINAF